MWVGKEPSDVKVVKHKKYNFSLYNIIRENTLLSMLTNKNDVDTQKCLQNIDYWTLIWEDAILYENLNSSMILQSCYYWLFEYHSINMKYCSGRFILFCEILLRMGDRILPWGFFSGYRRWQLTRTSGTVTQGNRFEPEDENWLSQDFWSGKNNWSGRCRRCALSKNCPEVTNRRKRLWFCRFASDKYNAIQYLLW